ncbi:MAG TPA: amidase family protein [Bryobacteraceae bacterium]|nr:amidase family protein [Bryobacteraceae bacterium]
MPYRSSLCLMASLVRERAISPVELVEAHLRQIESRNPEINAFVVVLAEEARAAARCAEEAVTHGEPLGLLHGVPVTVKDSFDMAGLPTLCGSSFRLDHRAAADATAVARLRAAGAIILGKTNCPEFLSNYETDNHLTGRTNNPWNLEYTPGGSSGGEAAAIAAFCSAGGIGSDGGGSVRIPAAFCGIAGLKPTPGRISAAGHFPLICHPAGLLGVAGPMARTAEDLRLLFAALAGYDNQDPFSAPVPLRAPDLQGLRVGVAEQFYQVPVAPAVRETVRRAAGTLEQIGIPAEEFQPEGLERAPNLWWFFFGQLPAPLTRQLIGGRENEAHWTGTEFLNQALEQPEPTAAQLLLNLATRDRMRASLLRQMEQYPVLLLAACGVTAFPHRLRRFDVGGREIGLFQAMMPATPFNLLGLPALVIPFGLSPEGLPVAIQLVGRPYEEELLLELAVKLEQARGVFPGPFEPRPQSQP